MNSLAMVGRLVADPEAYFGKDNTVNVVRFRIAVDRRFKRDGDPDADFFGCVAFGKTAEFVDKYFTKGMRIALTGRIENDNYEDQVGNKYFRDTIVIDNVEFCESKKDEEKPKEEKPAARVNFSKRR